MHSPLNLSECFVQANEEQCLSITEVSLSNHQQDVTMPVTVGSGHSKSPDTWSSTVKYTTTKNFRAAAKSFSTEDEVSRFYSICQPGSWEALEVSADMFEALVEAENTTEDIYHIAQAFRSRCLQTEETLANHSIQRASENDVEFGYLFRYPELRNRDSDEKWSIRQTGVYCKLGIGKRARSTWICFHPRHKSVAEEHLSGSLEIREEALSLVRNPLQVHIMIISCYFAKWRPYLLDIEEELLNLAMPVIGTIDKISDELRIRSLMRIRYLEGLVQPLVQIFQSMSEVLCGLQSLDATLRKRRLASYKDSSSQDDLENLLRQTRSYAGYAHFLLRRLECTAQMFSDGLALKNQRVVQEQSDQLYKLATIAQTQNAAICAMSRVTARDSATIRVITVATLVFLPTTFVATLFGTEVFYLTPEHTLAVAPQIWILAAVGVALTLLTLVFWYFRKRKHEVERESVFESIRRDDPEKGGLELFGKL